MAIEATLLTRSDSKCELCGRNKNLTVLDIDFRLGDTARSPEDEAILLCKICLDQIEERAEMDPHHWHCLNDSMWSQIPAVQVMAWRVLKRLSSEAWAQDALDMLYLDEQTLSWAQAFNEHQPQHEGTPHKDCQGAVIESGDTVVLTKDLNVKGANFTAKRGTAVRGISLVVDNPEQIEGRINGQRIVILTKYVKKG